MPIGRHLTAFAFTLPVALFSGACTNAKVGDATGGVDGADAGGGGGGGGSAADAGGGGADPLADAAPSAPDAGPLTLTHSQSLDIVGFNSVTCFEAVNSYYRVFDLDALGIDGPISVNKVTFGVEECLSGAAGLPATVKLHTLEGGLALGNLTQIAAADTLIPDVAVPDEGELGGLLHEVAIESPVPAGSTLVVEVTHPGLNQDQSLFMGSNRAGESDPSYLRAPECDTNEPTPAAMVPDEEGNFPTMHWVLVVDGQTGG